MKIPTKLIKRKKHSFLIGLILLCITAVLNTYFYHEHTDGLNAFIFVIGIIELAGFLNFRRRVKTGRYGNNERDIREILAFKRKYYG